MEDQHNSSVQKVKNQLETEFYRVADGAGDYLESLGEKRFYKVGNQNLDLIQAELYKSEERFLASKQELSLKANNSFNRFKKKLHNKIKKSGFESLNPEQKEAFLKAREFQSFYQVVHNLESIPHFVLSLKEFKSFNSCQILSLEKGSSFAESFFLNTAGETKSRHVTTVNFNRAFKSIKKSKSKLFQQTDLGTKVIEPLGTLLAKTFNYQNHSLILVISRNSFFPPEQEELACFESISQQLKLIFHSVFNRSKIDQSVDQAILILNEIALPIKISDSTEEIILFKNKAFLKNPDTEFIPITIDILDNQKLHIYPQGDSQQADAYHFYRINLLGELLNTLKHELSNPLFGLKLICDVLSSEAPDEEIATTLKEAGQSAERCQNILKNFTSLYSDEDSFAQFSLKKVIEETLILTKSETRGIRKKLEFISLDEDIEIETNSTWLSQIIFNLVINSSQAMTDALTSEPEINISVTREDKGIKITISDNGPGIDKEFISKVFQAFFTTKDKGTGLGLTICQNLANKLNSQLILEESSPKGTTFSMILK